MTASHAHPTSTAIQIPRTGELFGIAMAPKKPSRMTRPQSNARRASDRAFPRRKEATDSEGDKPETARREVNQTRGADRVGRPHGGADGKPVHRVCPEHGRHDHACAEGAEQDARRT